jgi:hypothetical protein
LSLLVQIRHKLSSAEQDIGTEQEKDTIGSFTFFAAKLTTNCVLLPFRAKLFENENKPRRNLFCGRCRR